MNAISRRSFLKTTAASAVLAAAGGRASSRAAANDRINVAIIGCRNRGHQVADTMLETGQFNIATFCDCDDAMIARAMLSRNEFMKIKPKKEKDFRRVLEDNDVDAVVNATPDHWHAMITVMALDAGKHVYLEKPASYNINDGKAMVAAQEKHPDLTVLVGTQQRSGQHFRDAKAFIDSGGLGRIGFCRACCVHEREVLPRIPDSDPPESLDYDMWTGPAAIEPYNEKRVHYNWHFMRNYGTGEMGNWGAHWLDVLAWFMDLGFPKAATALGGRVVDDIKEWPDTQTALFEYPGLTVLWEHRLWSRFGVGGGMGSGCEFDGDKGSILVSRGGWTFYPREKDAQPVRHDGSELVRAHAENFAAAIRGEAKPSASIFDGHKSATLCHLSNIAAVLNRRIEFDPSKQTIVGDDEASAMMGREYRKPWRLEDYV